MTADPAGQELNIGERVDYTRAHLPATQSDRAEPEFAETAARLSPKAKRWLAELYQLLAVTPLPGQSDLDIQPHPWVPNIYTVPFLDGHLVYAVLEWKGLVGILRYDP